MSGERKFLPERAASRLRIPVKRHDNGGVSFTTNVNTGLDVMILKP